MNLKRAKNQVGNARANARYSGHQDSDSTLTSDEWITILEQSNGRCHYCEIFFGVDHLVLEHKIPLSRGGLNQASNVAAACPKCNRRKMRNSTYIPPRPTRIW